MAAVEREAGAKGACGVAARQVEALTRRAGQGLKGTRGAARRGILRRAQGRGRARQFGQAFDEKRRAAGPGEQRGRIPQGVKDMPAWQPGFEGPAGRRARARRGGDGAHQAESQIDASALSGGGRATA